MYRVDSTIERSRLMSEGHRVCDIFSISTVDALASFEKLAAERFPRSLLLLMYLSRFIFLSDLARLLLRRRRGTRQHQRSCLSRPENRPSEKDADVTRVTTGVAHCSCSRGKSNGSCGRRSQCRPSAAAATALRYPSHLSYPLGVLSNRRNPALRGKHQQVAD